MRSARDMANGIGRIMQAGAIRGRLSVPPVSRLVFPVMEKPQHFVAPFWRPIWNANAQSFSTNSNIQPFVEEDVSKMTDEELADTTTIPGWDLIHSPPRRYPRGALMGKVVSTKMQKTINVAVDRYRIVPKIRKRQRYTRKFFAHDENEVANLGDLVMITPCQRISKHKHYMLREIIRPKGQL